MTVSGLLEQPCNKSDNIKNNNKGCYKLLTSCSKLVDILGQAVRRQLVGRLATSRVARLHRNKQLKQGLSDLSVPH
jgi:hypothetical protein